MPFEYFLFAFFVFVLAAVLIVLYRQLGAPQRKAQADEAARSQGERERQERLFRLYQNIEEMMDSFEGYLEQSREQMQAEHARMEEQIAEVRALCDRAEALGERLDHAEAQGSAAQAHAAAAEPEGQRRADTVRTMLDQGKTPEQIARAMDVSINEIKLIVYGLSQKPT
jgi:hypothetical protein